MQIYVKLIYVQSSGLMIADMNKQSIILAK